MSRFLKQKLMQNFEVGKSNLAVIKCFIEIEKIISGNNVLCKLRHPLQNNKRKGIFEMF